MPFDLNRPRPDRETCKWAAFCHLGGLASLTFIPLALVAVPFIVWMLRREDHPYIDRQGREAVNFQANMFVILLLAGMLAGVVEYFFWDIFGWLIFFPVVFVQVGGTIIGAIRAYDGEDFQYPCIFRLVKQREEDDAEDRESVPPDA
jgi:uncharacterized protein